MRDQATLAVPRRWFRGAALFPALGVVALPKCPMCVMLLFGVLGLGVPLHDLMFIALRTATLLGVTGLLVARRRSTPRPLLVVGLVGATGVLPKLAGVGPAEAGYAGALALAAALLIPPLMRPAACGCVKAEPVPD